LKKFKEQIGYKEDAKVEDKFGKSDRIAQGPDPDEEEKDDEKPSVVQLKESDLNAEEAEAEWRRCQEEAEIRAKDEEGVLRGPPTDDKGKIRFRKPKPKAETPETNDDVESDNKAERQETKSRSDEKKGKKEKEKKEQKEQKRSAKAVKNSQLLSFGDDEEDEET